MKSSLLYLLNFTCLMGFFFSLQFLTFCPVILFQCCICFLFDFGIQMQLLLINRFTGEQTLHMMLCQLG